MKSCKNVNNMRSSRAKGFRLAAKKLFLTYSQVNKNISVENVLEQLMKKVTVKNYLVALEKHQDGGHHFHVLLILNSRCDFTDFNCLDLVFENEKYHGNYQTAKNINSLISYLTKGNHYITNMKFSILDDEFVDPEHYTFIQAQKVGKDTALRDYIKNYPDRAVKKLSGLRTAIKIVEDLNVNKDVEKEFTLNDFDLESVENPGAIEDWLDRGCKETLILCGKAGTGKSLAAISLMDEKVIHYLRATEYEGLKNLGNEHQGFILDDANLTKLNPQEVINLFDTKNTSDLRLLHRSKLKQAKLVQILTINNLRDLIKFFSEAVERRVVIVHIKQSILKRDKVNITINNVNNIVNHGQLQINNNPYHYPGNENEYYSKSPYKKTINEKIWNEHLIDHYNEMKNKNDKDKN